MALLDLMAVVSLLVIALFFVSCEGEHNRKLTLASLNSVSIR